MNCFVKSSVEVFLAKILFRNVQEMYYVLLQMVIGNFQLMQFFSLLCSLSLYNKLRQRCFNDCVTTFYRKTLGKQEEICVRRCTEKFLRLSTSVAARYAELDQEGSQQ